MATNNIMTIADQIIKKTHQLLFLKWFIRLMYAAYGICLVGWILHQAPIINANPLPMLVLQLTPLIAASYCLISFYPPLLHFTLFIVLIYLCISSPNLFAGGFTQVYALVEVGINIILSLSLIFYLLKSSQLQRIKNSGSL